VKCYSFPSLNAAIGKHSTRKPPCPRYPTGESTPAPLHAWRSKLASFLLPPPPFSIRPSFTALTKNGAGEYGKKKVGMRTLKTTFSSPLLSPLTPPHPPPYPTIWSRQRSACQEVPGTGEKICLGALREGLSLHSPFSLRFTHAAADKARD